MPTLQPFLTLSPQSIADLRTNQSQTIALFFHVPLSSAFATYTGTVHLRQDDRTIPQTLKISLTVFDDTVPPPDPGPEGKTTLAGIDSDADGVRDDVQRYIALTYPDSRKARAALRQAARAYQAAILEANDRQSSISHIIDLFHANECLKYIRPADSWPIADALKAEFLNTLPRSKAWGIAGDQFGGQMYTRPHDSDLKSRCSFDPDAMEN